MATTNVSAVGRPGAERSAYRGNDKLLLGIVLSVVTFWLFAQTTLNVNPSMRKDLAIEANWMNIIDNGDIAQVHYSRLDFDDRNMSIGAAYWVARTDRFVA